MTTLPNNLQETKLTESKKIYENLPNNIADTIDGLKKIISNSVENILSDFGRISNGKEFKKYKVIINGEKAKVISNTPELGITVKFDNTGEIKTYSSRNEIDSFKILKKEKEHGISRKNNQN